MTLNFNLKVISGKRTDVKVEIYSTAVNSKVLEFKNSKKTMTDRQLADAIAELLTKRLKAWASEQ